MTPEQRKVASSIERALNRAGHAGLTGGVFDGTFCLWPGTSEDCPPGEGFFEAVEEKGISLLTPWIVLDGAAGV